jgi:signal transduction histidine kinase
MYVVVVALPSSVLRSVNDTAVSLLATGVIAVAFQPLRERLQRLANRVVYGYRATPYEVLAAFSRRVGDALSIEEVLPRIAEAAWRGLAATQARVRLFGPDGIDRVVVWPSNSESRQSFDQVVPVQHRGELVGEIAIGKPPGEPLTRPESVLLADLASEAGPALHNVRLTLELQARADELSSQAQELRASRQRIVSAQDAERRRLERDIHDGAQQSLVAIAVQLRLLKALVRKNPERAEGLAEQLGAQANDALGELRNLARGIFPPLLSDRGVATALRSHVDRAIGEVRLQVAADLEERRFPPEIETAMYFCIREALQNAAKHAPEARVEVALSGDQDWLRFEVRDCGPGFDPSRRRPSRPRVCKACGIAWRPLVVT